MLKFYFWWKCLEIVIMPIITIVAVAMASRNNLQSGKTSTAGQYFLMFFAILVRLYCLYLIYSFIKRLERGEQLLVEYGDKKLEKMIEELRSHQMKQQWDLELTERANSVRI